MFLIFLIILINSIKYVILKNIQRIFSCLKLKERRLKYNGNYK